CAQFRSKVRWQQEKNDEFHPPERGHSCLTFLSAATPEYGGRSDFSRYSTQSDVAADRNVRAPAPWCSSHDIGNRHASGDALRNGLQGLDEHRWGRRLDEVSFGAELTRPLTVAVLR